LEDLVTPRAVTEEGAKKPRGGRLSARRLSQVIPKAVLRCQKASKDLIELVLTYEGKMRVPTFISRERRYRTFTYTVNSDIYWRPETGFAFLMNLPRRTVKAVTWLLSAALLGYPGRLSSFDLDIKRMKKAIAFLTSKTSGGPGELIRVILRDVQIDGNHFEELNLRGRDLHTMSFYKKVLSGANSIRAISFLTPLIKGIGRPLSCRMDDSGSVLVYSPRLSNSELRVLLDYFEKMFKQRLTT
jgi:hypothetical protein